MLIIRPRGVRFDGSPWTEVSSIALDRGPARAVVEWGDLGPHPTLADVPEVRTTVRIVRRLLRDEPDGVRPGDAGELVFEAAPAGGAAQRRRWTIACVVMRTNTEVDDRRGAQRTIELVAVSTDGAADPVSSEPV